VTKLHSRISLADLDIAQRHSRFRRTTFENAFPAVPGNFILESHWLI